MPPSSDSTTPSPSSPLLSQNAISEKYRFPYSKFIFYALFTSVLLFFVFFMIVVISFSQFASNNSFNNEFYDSCGLNSSSMNRMFNVRSNVYSDKLAIKSVNITDSMKVNEEITRAIHLDIILATITECIVQESQWTKPFKNRVKSIWETQLKSVNLIFKIYIPLSIFLLLAILVAFLEAKKSNLSKNQQKIFNFFGIFFVYHIFIYILILYCIISDTSKNFKPNEIPSICTKEDSFLTEECYFNDKNCLEMFSLPKMVYGKAELTVAVYLFSQIVLLIVLKAFEKCKSAKRDGYEHV